MVAILFLVVGGVSWMLLLGRAPLAVDASSLSSIPLEVGRWAGEDFDIPSGVAEMLDADFHVQRAYYHPLANVVWLYVGYYGTDRGGRPEHTPWVCYPSNGWKIEREQVVEVMNGEVERVNELLVQQGGEYRLVHFWYQSNRRSGMLGDLDQAIDRLISRLDSGRADGSLIRLSTPLRDRDDTTTARVQLITFGKAIAPLLRSHWPSESEAL